MEKSQTGALGGATNGDLVMGEALLALSQVAVP